MQPAGEPVVDDRVVVGDRGGPVHADVEGLVEGEVVRDGRRDHDPSDLGAVHPQRDGAALADPATGVGELHPHLVSSGGQGFVAARGVHLKSEVVVGVAEPALVEIHRPAAESTALGDEDPFRAAVGDLDFRGDGV